MSVDICSGCNQQFTVGHHGALVEHCAKDFCPLREQLGLPPLLDKKPVPTTTSPRLQQSVTTFEGCEIKMSNGLPRLEVHLSLTPQRVMELRTLLSRGLNTWDEGPKWLFALDALVAGCLRGGDHAL
jgi:hypothetical protein